MNPYTAKLPTSEGCQESMGTCAKRTGTIEDQFKMLDSAIKELESRIGQLGERIEPILSPLLEPKQMDDNSKNCPPSVLPPLAAIIEGQRTTIDRMIKAVVSLSARVEL